MIWFLCQKLKRDINYDAQIKELLSSNNQEDLRKLFKIFEQERDSIRYNFLMKNINYILFQITDLICVVKL